MSTYPKQLSRQSQKSNTWTAAVPPPIAKRLIESSVKAYVQVQPNRALKAKFQQRWTKNEPKFFFETATSESQDKYLKSKNPNW